MNLTLKYLLKIKQLIYSGKVNNVVPRGTITLNTLLPMIYNGLQIDKK